MHVLQEVLSRPGESEKTLNAQEYWILTLLELTETHDPGFAVQRTCWHWSEIEKDFVFEAMDREHFTLLVDAQKKYETWRALLVQGGFVHSDLEL